MTSLAETLSRHGIDCSPETIELLDRYRARLWDWNERLNLTRHPTIDKFVARDVLDSYKLAELLPPKDRVLDVGTGGGVPGVIVKILRPDLKVSLCESTAKKAKAAEAIVAEIELDVPVYHARAEDILGVRPFDSLVARAVAPLEKMLRWFQPHWDAFDQLLLIKGCSWSDERSAARKAGLLNQLQLRRAATYQTPGGGESVILRVWRGDDDLDA